MIFCHVDLVNPRDINVLENNIAIAAFSHTTTEMCSPGLLWVAMLMLWKIL